MNQEKVRVGLNGGGTIGRAVLERLAGHPQLDIAALNEVAPVTSLVSHLRRRGAWPARDVRAIEDRVEFGTTSFRLFDQAEPSDIPWREAGVDIVIEATGRFTEASRARGHLEAGASYVLVTAPSSGANATVVRGVTDARLAAPARVVSAGSATSAAVAPLLHVLDQAFGIDCAGFIAIDAASNDQSVGGAPGREAGRAFSTLDNCFAVPTGAHRAIEELLPALKGHLVARALRVPVSVGSRIELWASLGRETSTGEVLALLERQASGPLNGILAIGGDYLAAADVRGATASCIVEAPSVVVSGGRHLMIAAWHDNVTAFSCRVVEIAERMAVHVTARESALALATT
jgi:glyceraldehyde 3-phosphate dehydrogenase